MIIYIIEFSYCLCAFLEEERYAYNLFFSLTDIGVKTEDVTLEHNIIIRSIPDTNI